MAAHPNERLQGTLDLLILKVLRHGATHGWDIARQIQVSSRDVLQIHTGSLYPALHRLEERGWISAEWGASENNRRARFYRLSAAGKRELVQETASWEEYVLAVTRVIRTASPT